MAALDEAFTPDGAGRDHYAPVLAAVRDRDLGALAGDLAGAHDMRHGAGEADHAFAFDPLPRVIAADEWAALEAGLRQRIAALDAFVADAHGPREAVRAGVVPAAAVDECPWYERDLLDLPAPRVRIGVAGPDVVRGADGRLAVLEDNVRTPTMMAYSAVGRPLVSERLGVAPDPPDLAGPLRDALWRVLRAAAPDVDEPRVAILTEGAGNALWWEVDALGALLGVPVVAPRDLRAADYDVLYRRTSEERLDGELRDLLLEPLRAGEVAVVNAFGTGVADDKRVFPYVEDLVRFFCGDEPLLPSVPAFDLTRSDHREEVLDRLAELVVKPRGGSGGYGVLIGPRATPEQLDEVRRAIDGEPGAWIAQEVVELSTHPTVVGGALEPRHSDLRPFAFAVDGEVEVLRGAFSRFARDRGEMVVNCSQGGGGRDVWVEPS
jgi:uncharacterized circularly permuted ATP-grasp superfamily protein